MSRPGPVEGILRDPEMTLKSLRWGLTGKRKSCPGDGICTSFVSLAPWCCRWGGGQTRTCMTLTAGARTFREGLSFTF